MPAIANFEYCYLDDLDQMPLVVNDIASQIFPTIRGDVDLLTMEQLQSAFYEKRKFDIDLFNMFFSFRLHH